MIKEISFNKWKEEYEWIGSIWVNDTCRKMNQDSISKFFFWTSIRTEEGDILIPGIHDSGQLIYQTKKPIDQNIIVIK